MFKWKLCELLSHSQLEWFWAIDHEFNLKEENTFQLKSTSKYVWGPL